MHFDTPITIGATSMIAGKEVTIRDQVHIQTFTEGHPRYLVTMGIFTDHCDVTPINRGRIIVGGEAPDLLPNLGAPAADPTPSDRILWEAGAYRVFHRIRLRGHATHWDALELLNYGYPSLEHFSSGAINRGEVTDRMVADFLDTCHREGMTTHD